MKPLLKGLFIFVGLLALVIIAFLWWFNPNSYKPELNQALSEKLGREVNIVGTIDWSFYPWLGLTIGRTEVAQAPGFDIKKQDSDFAPAHFAHYRKVSVQVKLLPLLKQRFEVGDILVTGAMLNLQRYADGSNNWQDLLAKTTPAEKPTTSTAEPEKKSAYQWQLSRLFFQQAEVFWQDHVETKRHLRLQDFNLETSVLDFKQAISLQADAKIDDNQHLNADLHFKTQLRADLPRGRWTLNNTQVQIRGQEQVVLPQTQSLDWQLPKIQYQAPHLAVDASVLTINQLPIQISDLIGEFSAEEGLLKAVKLDMAGVKSEFDWRFQAGQAWQSHVVIDSFDPRPLFKHFQVLQAVPTHLLSSLGARFDIDADKTGLGIYNLSLNLGEQQLKADKLHWQSADKRLDIVAALKLNGIELDIQAQAEAQGQIEGTLRSQPFNPKALLADWGIALPNTANPEALSLGQWSSRFYWHQQQLQLSDINARLDGSQLQGLLSLNLNQAHIQAQLQTDKLNISDYLPPSVAKQSRAYDFYPVAQAAAPTLLPTWLSQWQGQGQLDIGELHYQQLQCQQLQLPFNSDGKRLLLTPSAKLYEGELSASIVLVPDSNAPKLMLHTDLKAVNLEPLFAAWTQQDSRIRGHGHIVADLSANLQTAQSLEQSLNGTLKVNVDDGALRGIDLLYQIDNFRALLKHAPAPDYPDSKETAFDNLQGQFQLQQQNLHTDALQVSSKRLNFSATGDMNLQSRALDYQIQARFSEDKLIGARSINIPVQITGSLDAPKPKIDLKNLISTQDQAWKDKLKQKAREKLRKWFD